MVNKYFLRLQFFDNQCVAKKFCHAKSGSKTGLIEIAHLIVQKSNLNLEFEIGKIAESVMPLNVRDKKSDKDEQGRFRRKGSFTDQRKG